MKVILMEDVGGLGDIGETVTVKPGYARNFLIPRGKALELEARNAKQVKHQMIQIEAKKRKLKAASEAVAERIRELSVVFQLKVNQAGRVFGSIGAKDIADKLTELGFVTDRRKVTLTESLKKVGTHFVKIRLHADVDVQLKVAIEATEATKEDEDKAVRAAKEQIEEATAEA
jgi:large subunit ribosomal protein L9